MPENNVNQRLADLMAAVPNPKFDKANPHFGNDYASLEEELKVKVLAHKHGFRIHQTVIKSEDPQFVSTLIDNETGTASQSVTMPFVMDKQTTQGLGSALTYHRRYGIDLLLNRVGQADDDGEAAEGRGTKKKTTKKQHRETGRSSPYMDGPEKENW